ncbi:hypothetical protein T01_19 [Trichinella spiralis]|uniref:Uncharacterized protein n=1 Tax=Trichinella spiralis TaxID=6334 RepID=A0A0V1B8R7_TRISP|nr:hypothetical protein T01_19 [Trichinella spiralis]
MLKFICMLKAREGSVRNAYLSVTEEEREHPIRKFDGRLIKIYRRPKRATQLLDALPLRPNDHYPIASLLLQIFFTYTIDRASAERSFTEVLEVSKKLFPDYHDRKTTVRTLSNVFVLSVFLIDLDLLIEKFSLKRN